MFEVSLSSAGLFCVSKRPFPVCLVVHSLNPGLPEKGEPRVKEIATKVCVLRFTLIVLSLDIFCG